MSWRFGIIAIGVILTIGTIDAIETIVAISVIVTIVWPMYYHCLQWIVIVTIGANVAMVPNRSP